MAEDTTQADGYYSEDEAGKKEDFDLTFLDEDESEK